MEYLFFIFILFIVFILVFLYQGLIRSKANPIIKILPLSLFLIIPLWAFFNPKDNKSTNILKPITNFVEENISPSVHSEELEKIIQSELESADEAYGIAIKNLKTNEYYYYNNEREFDTASLYKLWVMGAVYEEIEKGNLSLEQNIGFEASTINERLDLASESAEITEGFVGNTVEGALERMITISDNYSAHILYLTIGWSTVGDFIEKYGFSNSSTDTLTTTPDDILNYFEKLYKGEIVSQNASSEMMEILKRQQLNDRIPKYIPENIKTAHKTGELGAVKHDAGIVFNPKGDYIIVLMSKTGSQVAAAEIEAKISEKVWNYFNK